MLVVRAGIETEAERGNGRMNNAHECKTMESCNSISIEKVQGKWLWIFHKKKKTEAHGIKFCPYCGVNLEDLEETETLIKLPCAIGHRVYEIYRFLDEGAWEIEEHRIRLEDLDKIGKTVFLTREEAEAAISG